MEKFIVLLKIASFVLAICNYVSYKKSNDLRDYIGYWGCVIVALLY